MTSAHTAGRRPAPVLNTAVDRRRGSGRVNVVTYRSYHRYRRTV